VAIDSVHYGRTAYALGSNVFRCSGHFILSSRDTVSNNFSRRHVLISVNQYIIESRRFSLSKTNSQHISPSTENLACSSTYCSGPKAWRPRHSCFAGVALVADHRENTVQAVPAGAQDVRRARSRLHCQPVDAHLWHSFTVVAAFVE